MRFLISGPTGLIGQHLGNRLESDGHTVCGLTRSPRKPGDVAWSPAKGQIDTDALEGVDAVVHLAGESIAGRWTKGKKHRIRQSRVAGTSLLAEALAKLDRQPEVLICASAVGYYGDRGDETLTETSPPGEGFLPEVCMEWEQAAKPALDAGIRVVHLRLGVVLSTEGGALSKMLLPFKLGLGGRVGSGRQFVSWIGLHDAVAGFAFAATHDSLNGAVNLSAPNPATNLELTKAMGRALHRPTIFPLPAFAAKLLLGEMAEGLLLASAKVLPTRLLEAGFTFEHVGIDEAVKAAIEQNARK